MEISPAGRSLRLRTPLFHLLRQAIRDGRIDQAIGFTLRRFAGDSLTFTQGLLLPAELLLLVAKRLLLAS